MKEFQNIVSIMPWTMIFTLCNLLILTLGIKKYLFKPVQKVLDERKQQVNTLYETAQKAQTDALDMRADYEKRLANAKDEAAGIVKDATANASLRATEIVDTAKRDAQHVKTKAEADILRDRKKAETELKNDISSIALSIAGKVVEKEIDASRHKTLIDEFIDNVGDAG